MSVKISVKDNGPFRVEFGVGELEVQDGQGSKVPLGERTAISLCRCGASVNKPFCDGTHGRCGFESQVRVASDAK